MLAILMLVSSVLILGWVLYNRPAPVPDGAVKECPRCGTEASLSARSCPKCGLQPRPVFNLPLFLACFWFVLSLVVAYAFVFGEQTREALNLR